MKDNYNNLETRSLRSKDSLDIQDMSFEICWLMNEIDAICNTRRKYNFTSRQQEYSNKLLFDDCNCFYYPKHFKINNRIMYKVIEDYNCVYEKLLSIDMRRRQRK